MLICPQWSTLKQECLSCLSESEVFIKLFQLDCVDPGWLHVCIHQPSWHGAMSATVASWLDRHVPRMDQLYNVPQEVGNILLHHSIIIQCSTIYLRK